MWIFAGFSSDFGSACGSPYLFWHEERSSVSETINVVSFLLINKMKAINRLFDDLKLALPRFTSKV